MREIKFRAWDLRKKEMHPSYPHQGKNSRLYVGWLRDDESDDDVRLELMQYTGLKDKNGREIYEGDVVDYFDDYDMNSRGVVKYFGETERSRVGCYYVDDQDGYWSYFNEMPDDRPIEVIGNIYEHSDLLANHEKEPSERTE